MTDDIKLPLTSADMTEALLAQLRAASPQIFSEGRVDFAKLQAALGEHIETNPERYGLSWAGKRDAFRNVQVPSVATLRPQLEESINWDSSENLIIEGDNLEVLKLLQKPYHGKVKMIYIDPPYNTGNEFIYPDNFREGLDEYLRYTGQLGEDGTATSTNKDTSGRYHSNWLNMMYPRLFLARNLLREDGVIFVSIDDHEVHNLRLLMDEVFGEENVISTLVWKKKYTGGQHSQFYADLHEYVLVYARNVQNQPEFSIVRSEVDKEKFTEQDRHVATRGRYYVRPLKSNLEERRTLVYPITMPDGTVLETQWLVGRDRFEAELEQERIEFRQKRNGEWQVYKKYYELDGEGKVKPPSLIEKFPNTEGKTDLKKLFDVVEGRDNIFYTVKPVNLIKFLSEPILGSGDLALDFFAGSGTTAHAVLDLNQQDGGNRKFILVQLPEKTDNPQYPTIAHITRERVRRVIAKLQESRHSRAGGNPVGLNQRRFELLDSRLRGNDVEGQRNDGDLGFRAFKLDSSNFKIWRSDQAPQSAEQLAEQLSLYADNIQPDRSDQDRLYELILKCGMPLSARVEEIHLPVRPDGTTSHSTRLSKNASQVAGYEPVEGQAVHASTGSARTAFSVSDGNLLICLEPHLDRDTLRTLFARKPQMVLCLDVAFDGNDALKTNTVLEAQTHQIVFKTV